MDLSIYYDDQTKSSKKQSLDKIKGGTSKLTKTISIYDRYAIGGLEQDKNKELITMNIDDTIYVISDKFRSMLQDLIIDWGTFLEIYHENVEYCDLFDQVTKLLNIKDNENIRESLLPIIKEIYELPAEAQLSCMIKQFIIYEPLSISIHSLFSAIKYHYEIIVKKFIECRNKYIIDHKLKAPLNNWNELLDSWNESNSKNNLESSSVILLFLHPPKGLDNDLHIKVPGNKFTELNQKLLKGIKEFTYPGFCPKVPHQRLVKLLKFPINEFIDILKTLDSSIIFPNYEQIEKEISAILNTKIEKPKITHEFKLEKPPSDLDENNKTDRLQLIKWYVSKILEMRKGLFSDGEKYESYYENMAKLISESSNTIKKEFIKWK